VPLSLSNIVVIKLSQKEYEKAEYFNNRAMDISKQTGHGTGLQSAYVISALLGRMTNNQKMLQDGLSKTVKHIEEEISYYSNRYSSDIFDNNLIWYELLAITKLEERKGREAFQLINRSKNRSLKRRLNYKVSDFSLLDQEQNEAFLMLEEINSESHSIYNMAQAFPNQKGFELDEEWGKNLNQLFIFMATKDSIYWNLFPKGISIFDENRTDLKTLAKVYLNQLKQTTENSVITEELAKKLHDTLIKGYASEINQEKLIIAPDPIISNIPLETLIDKDGKYLVEKFDVSYIQSYTVLELLREREYSNSKDKILALGGIEYSDNDFTTISDDNIEYLITVRSNTNQYSTNDIFGSLGYSDWKPLPGSLEEINSIKGEFPQAEIFSGKNASESFIKSLSKNNELKKYNIIHFATHGVVMPDLPQLSSIILSSSQNENEDGYLTVNEIAQLEINADFVNLSACETGLGKVYAGDGVIGLTQAFMEAGANGVLVSLWPVEDQSTAIFMTSVYAKIADGFTYSFAITDTKRDFISGKYGEEYKKPYYWAPFVYYGK